MDQNTLAVPARVSADLYCQCYGGRTSWRSYQSALGQELSKTGVDGLTIVTAQPWG
jgi:hypothetical protein